MQLGIELTGWTRDNQLAVACVQKRTKNWANGGGGVWRGYNTRKRVGDGAGGTVCIFCDLRSWNRRERCDATDGKGGRRSARYVSPERMARCLAAE